MKTTIEISNSLLKEARKLAAREGVSLRALVERGLRQVLKSQARGGPFRLRKATFRGSGLQADLEDASWAQIRDRVYEGRGA